MPGCVANTSVLETGWTAVVQRSAIYTMNITLSKQLPTEEGKYFMSHDGEHIQLVYASGSVSELYISGNQAGCEPKPLRRYAECWFSSKLTFDFSE